jgi:hypothetical protein
LLRKYIQTLRKAEAERLAETYPIVQKYNNFV